MKRGFKQKIKITILAILLIIATLISFILASKEGLVYCHWCDRFHAPNSEYCIKRAFE